MSDFSTDGTDMAYRKFILAEVLKAWERASLRSLSLYFVYSSTSLDGISIFLSVRFDNFFVVVECTMFAQESEVVHMLFLHQYCCLHEQICL